MLDTPKQREQNPSPRPYRNVRERRRIAEAIRNAAYRSAGAEHAVTAEMVFKHISPEARRELNINLRAVRSHLAHAYWAEECDWTTPADGTKRVHRTYKMMP